MPTRDLEELATIPPALLLMFREFASESDWQRIRKRVRSALPDMREQSFVFESQNVRRNEVTSSSSFQIHLHGALDLLSGHGCVAPECRVAAAERLARSFGLLADQVWLTDHLSTEVMRLGRVTNAALDRLMYHAVALAPLLPLMRAGIVRFRSPWIATCNNCSSEFDHQVEDAAAGVLRMFRRQVKVERKESGGFFVRTGSAFDPPLYMHSYSSTPSAIPSSAEYAGHLVAREVRQILWTAREASMTGGAVFSNSRMGLAGMLQCEGRLPRSGGLSALEDSRVLDLPWVSELNADQVLQLREEASLAIPHFRELLARAMSGTASEAHEASATELLSELRAQAAEVRAELTIKQAKSARYWKVAYGVLGLGLSAYGVVTDQVLPGVGGLLPILQLLISHKAGHESDVAKLESRPGYVLVRAQDILAHAHS